MNAPFEYRSSGRSTRNIAILIGLYVVLIAAFIAFDTVWWIIAFLVATTLPMVWDIYSDRKAGLRLSDTQLEWWSGRAEGQMPLAEIDHMRFDTRLDFSVRVSAVTPTKQRIRLPYDAVPPHKVFEAACHAHGIRTERHHFSLL